MTTVFCNFMLDIYDVVPGLVLSPSENRSMTSYAVLLFYTLVRLLANKLSKIILISVNLLLTSINRPFPQKHPNFPPLAPSTPPFIPSQKVREHKGITGIMKYLVFLDNQPSRNFT